MHRHRIDRVQPFRLFRFIGSRRIGIQHGNNGSPDLNRKGDGISGTVIRGKCRKEGVIPASMRLTDSRSKRLPNDAGVTGIQVRTNDRRLETHGPPPTKPPLSVDEKDGRTVGFLTNRLGKALQDVPQGCCLVKCSQGRSQTCGPREIGANHLQLMHRGIRFHAGLLRLASSTIDRVLEFVPCEFFVSPDRFELLYERFSFSLSVVQILSRRRELLAHVVERSLEHGSLGRRALQLFALAIEFTLHHRELLLGLLPHFGSSTLRRIDHGVSLLVGCCAGDVGSRCDQLRFELSAQRRADAVEHRSDVVVERRGHG